MVGEGLGDEPRLADTGVAVDDDRAAGPLRVQRGERLGEHGLLGLPPGEGQLLAPASGSAGARLDPELDGVQRHRLALDVERRERHGREEGPRPVDDRQAAVHRARAGGRHEAGGDVHGVAHDRVGGAVAHPDLAREDVAAVDPDLQREAGVGVGQASDGAQHPAFTVLASGRNPCGDDDLAAVAVDVGGQERQLLGVDGLLPARITPSSAAATGSGPPSDIRASMPENRTNPTVAARCSCSISPPDRWVRRPSGTSTSSVSGGTDREAAGPMGAAPGWRHRSFQPGPTGAPAARGGEQGARGGADHDLARAGDVFHRRRRAGRRTGDDELTVGAADQEHVDSPLCTPTDICSGTRPTEVGRLAAWRSAARISTAALAA